MIDLAVWIEIKGDNVYVGQIKGTKTEDARFSYAEEYMNRTHSRPISISLPFQKEEFSADKTRCFFEGLLPEGFTRKCVADEMKVDVNDYICILENLGNECLGAVRITNESGNETHYIELSRKELEDFAKEGASESAQFVTKSHLSLTGASGKTGLYYDETGGKWYLPVGTAPSTHIVKQSHVRLKKIVANEQLCLLTAEYLGIATPNSFILDLGGDKDSDVLFATKRYDRVMANTGKQIDGLRTPYRLHQEDCAQALGIPSYLKYEKNGDGYLKKLFDLLKNNSTEPLEDQLRLWNICIFNYLIGNTDNHIKNLSLLYNEDMKEIRLAPAYDIVSTMFYESSTNEMALSIGGVYDINKINRDSFEKEAKNIGLGLRNAMNQYDKMVDAFPEALEQATKACLQMGFADVEKISEKILNSFVEKRG